MNEYIISAQFVSTTAKFDADAKDAIEKGVENYNSRSLIAKNPKKISKHSFSEDESTLNLTLESEAELPMPTRALKLLSSYLVEETCLGERLAGKQLFKMTAESVQKPSVENEEDANEEIPPQVIVNLIEGLQKLSWSSEDITDFMLYVCSGEEQHIEKITSRRKKED
nr:MAG TPA: hypothetical protein [Caudoviricetes sp.]